MKIGQSWPCKKNDILSYLVSTIWVVSQMSWNREWLIAAYLVLYMLLNFPEFWLPPLIFVIYCLTLCHNFDGTSLNAVIFAGIVSFGCRTFFMPITCKKNMSINWDKRIAYLTITHAAWKTFKDLFWMPLSREKGFCSCIFDSS